MKRDGFHGTLTKWETAYTGNVPRPMTCPKCKRSRGRGGVEKREWESVSGFLFDTQYKCPCGHTWWKGGIGVSVPAGRSLVARDPHELRDETPTGAYNRHATEEHTLTFENFTREHLEYLDRGDTE